VESAPNQGDAPGGDLRSPLFAWAWRHSACRVVPSERRRELLAGLTGRGIEVGIGTGVAIDFYPPTIASLDAVEPEPALRAIAESAARSAPFPVAVTAGTAEATGRPDEEFDFAVSSLVLCSVADPGAALGEIRRVLKPGGELRFYEHVAADHVATRAVQRGLDRSSLWPAVAGGCHLARDTAASVAAAGFELAALKRFTAGPRGVGVPFLLGRATRA
jgi:SAM-dependent methyltransferase